MTKKLEHTVFIVEGEKEVFHGLEIDYTNMLIYGDKLFPTYGESNPVRCFPFRNKTITFKEVK